MSTPPKGIKLLIGTAGFGIGEGRDFNDTASCQRLFDALQPHKELLVSGIDTAVFYDSYGGAAALIGGCKAGEIWAIDTKMPGQFIPGSSTREGISRELGKTLERLAVPSVNILYLHSHDPSIPLEDTLAGIHDVHSRGLIKRFGVSNFLPEDVQAVYDICTAKGYILPTVYQGNYSVFNRHCETLLFPLLRKLGMSFYCYSALAGGFTLKTKQEVKDGKGRFDPNSVFGGLYNDMYGRPSLLDALDDWGQIAEDEGCTKGELAYRWVRFSSLLKQDLDDGMVFGVSQLHQIDETLGWLQGGPLSEGACARIDAMWEKVKGEAPLDTVNRGSDYKPKT